MFLHPHAAADWLTTILPAFFVPLISIFRNWTYALFYMLANLWGTVVVSLLFWSFANEISTVEEAKKYYPLFGMVDILFLFQHESCMRIFFHYIYNIYTLLIYVLLIYVTNKT